MQNPTEREVTTISTSLTMSVKEDLHNNSPRDLRTPVCIYLTQHYEERILNKVTQRTAQHPEKPLNSEHNSSYCKTTGRMLEAKLQYITET
jgi:hypothetical protein